MKPNLNLKTRQNNTDLDATILQTLLSNRNPTTSRLHSKTFEQHLA
ncbi:hypothetical protein ACKWCA_11315 [Maribacter sp. 2307UL18-2]